MEFLLPSGGMAPNAPGSLDQPFRGPEQQHHEVGRPVSSEAGRQASSGSAPQSPRRPERQPHGDGSRHPRIRKTTLIGVGRPASSEAGKPASPGSASQSLRGAEGQPHRGRSESPFGGRKASLIESGSPVPADFSTPTLSGGTVAQLLRKSGNHAHQVRVLALFGGRATCGGSPLGFGWGRTALHRFRPVREPGSGQ